MNRREMLEIWLRAVLADSRTAIDDKVALSDKLERLEILPPETWMTVDVYRLEDEAVDMLSADVRAVIERNPIAEALASWELWHDTIFE